MLQGECVDLEQPCIIQRKNEGSFSSVKVSTRNMITDNATATLQRTEKKNPIESLRQTMLMQNADVKGNIIKV